MTRLRFFFTWQQKPTAQSFLAMENAGTANLGPGERPDESVTGEKESDSMLGAPGRGGEDLRYRRLHSDIDPDLHDS